MLVCYLDDSGKDPQNQCTALAGYVARESEWIAFEQEVEKWFSHFEVGVLHATNLQGTRADFEAWSILKKQAFVARICQARNPRVMLGVSIAAQKSTYRTVKEARVRIRTASPYGFCFNIILGWILTDIRTGRAAHDEGVKFVIEQGHENNGDAERIFYDVRKKYGLNDVLLSIEFVPKEHCRAIQLADLLAFYSRRGAESSLAARQNGDGAHSVEWMEKILIEGLPHRGYVATAFGDDAEGSRFFGGDL